MLKIPHQCIQELFVTKRTGFPVAYRSNPQSKTSLMTAEAEHISVSPSLREAIPLVCLFKEISTVIIMCECVKKMKCAVFEDNNGALEMSKTPKIKPRTKHIAIKCYHF